MASRTSNQAWSKDIDAGTYKCGPGSVVGIATSYGLDGPGIESRWGARFSALVQTGPGAHPASCTMGTGSFPGVKRGRDVTLTPHPLLVPWSWKSRAIPLPPYGLYGLYRASVFVQGCTLPFSQLNKGGGLFLTLEAKQVCISKTPLAGD